VVIVTVAVDNGELLSALASHANVKRQMENEIGGDNLTQKLSWVQNFINSTPSFLRHALQNARFGRDIHYWHYQLMLLNEEILFLQDGDPFSAMNVYVTFDTEAAQLNCLQKTGMGTIPRMLNMTSADQKRHVFRGGKMLNIAEAVEPSAVLWQNIGVGGAYGAVRTYGSQLVFYLAIVVSFFAITALSEVASETVVVTAITVMNVVFPIIIREATGILEIHEDQESMQVSIFNKMTLFRISNSAFIILATTPFNELLTEKFLLRVMGVLISQCVTTPLLILIDPKAKLIRFLFASHAQTQEKMNDFYIGGTVHLADYYSNVANTTFIAVVYMAILPQGVFVAMAGLLVNFWCLKFMLLRRWKPQPKLSARMARLVLKYIHAAVLLHICFTRAMFASWPFDSACLTTSVSTTAPRYEKCNKNAFQAVYYMERSPWQTDDQFFAVELYNFMLTAVILGLALNGTVVSKATVMSLFFAKSKGVQIDPEEGSEITYSAVEGVESYIPSLHQQALLYPVVAADCSHLISNLLPATVRFAANIKKATGHPVPLLYEYMELEMERQEHSMVCELPELGVLTINLECLKGTDDLKAGDMRFKMTVVGAKGLLAMDVTGTSDAFCRLYRGFESVGTTTTKMKTLQPEWNEEFIVDFIGDNKSKPFGVTVLDYDYSPQIGGGAGAGEFLGKIQITNHELTRAWQSGVEHERECKLMPHYATTRLDRFFSVVKGYGDCGIHTAIEEAKAHVMTRQASVYTANIGGAASMHTANIGGAFGSIANCKAAERAERAEALLAATEASMLAAGVEAGAGEGATPTAEAAVAAAAMVWDVWDARAEVDVAEISPRPSGGGTAEAGVAEGAPAGAGAEAEAEMETEFTDTTIPAWTYAEPTGKLPDEVTIQVSRAGIAISAEGHTYHESSWGRTEFHFDSSENQVEMDLFSIRYSPSYACIARLH
jgi:hypothetical protein